MEHNSGRGEVIPTPEVLAGQEVKRLRKRRGWSQEEVARRMAVYGFDSWHQTTVGRTEIASRPLRLNEAIALAALFEVPVTQLLVPHSVRVEDIDEEIRVTEQQRDDAVRMDEEMRPRLVAAEAGLQEAADAHRKLTAAIEWADTHLEMLRGIRKILSSGADLPPELVAQATGVYELARRRDLEGQH